LKARLLLPTSIRHPSAIDLSPVPATALAVNLPPHWHHGAFMEVFVRGYQDSDGDGIDDLKGLISRPTSRSPCAGCSTTTPPAARRCRK
jgi:hypothetical protein